MDLTFILLRCVIIFNICGLVLGGWVSSFSKLTSSSRFLDDGPTTIEKSETRRRASYEEGVAQQVSYPEPQAVLPLARVGYQYATNISFGDSFEQKVQNVIFDTGSRSLVLRECANLTANASLISQYQNCYHPTNGSNTAEGWWPNDVYCLTIYIDQGIMSTEGCTVYTDKVRAGDTSAGSAGDLYVLSARTLASTDAALHPLGDVGGLLGGAFPAPELGQSALTQPPPAPCTTPPTCTRPRCAGKICWQGSAGIGRCWLTLAPPAFPSPGSSSASSLSGWKMLSVWQTHQMESRGAT